MADYPVDRSRLEALSTSEILRILKKEREDYTPEAIRILEEILVERGVAGDQSEIETFRHGPSGSAVRTVTAADVLVKSPSDAVRVLDGLLKQVLDGTVEPEVAQTATNIVLAILRAMEQAYMTEPGEDT